MLTEICAELRNYFEVPNGRHFGKFTISGGSIAPLDFLQEGQYFRIVGSIFNDGVYKYSSSGPASLPRDEIFCGSIWSMAVPSAVVDLAEEIKKFNESDEAKPSSYTSESFGGYSYSKATDGNGAPIGWKKVFASRLNKYRRINVL